MLFYSIFIVFLLITSLSGQSLNTSSTSCLTSCAYCSSGVCFTCINGYWDTDCDKTCYSCSTCDKRTGFCMDCIYPTGTCSFYLSCLEAYFPCGPDGYAQSFGDMYCNAFVSPTNFNSFSVAGQTWIKATLLCLQVDIVAIVFANYPNLNCNLLSDLAFASHPSCYVNSGFCNIPLDWGHVIGVVWKALLSNYAGKIVQQMLLTADICGTNYITAIYLTVQADVTKVESFLSQAINSISTLVNINANRFFIPSFSLYSSGQFNALGVEDITINLLIFPGGANSTNSSVVASQLNESLTQQPSLAGFPVTGFNICANKTVCYEEMFGSNSTYNIATTSSSQPMHNSSSKFSSTFGQFELILVFLIFLYFN